jgi:Copper transport outer membrane protein, MctB
VINFRYHVVSLTAVFLALAIGLVVGTAALNGPAVDALSDQVNGIGRQNQQLRDQVNHFKDEANTQEQFATQAAPIMLADKLRNRRVMVVALPAAGKYVKDVTDMLQTGGAKITARVEVQDKFTESTNNSQLLDLATITRPVGVSEPATTNTDGVETSTALLAAVLMDRKPGQVAVPDDQRRTVLSAYAQGGWIIVTGDVAGPAEAVVLLTGAPYVDHDAAKRNTAVVTVAEQLRKAGPIVVGSDGVGTDGNAVTAVRRDPVLTKSISTVDNIATPQGRVVVALALAEQLNGASGHYGIGDGAATLIPKPAASKTSGS